MKTPIIYDKDSFDNEKLINIIPKKRRRKLMALGIAAGLLLGGAAASVGLGAIGTGSGGAGSTLDSLTGTGASGNGSNSVGGPPPVVEVIEYTPATIPTTVYEDMLQQNQQQSYPARGIIMTIIGVVGSLIAAVAELLWHLILSPVVSHILVWVIIGLAVLGALAAALHAVFPDIPLRELLTKKRVGGVFMGVACVALFCGAVPLFFDGAEFLPCIRTAGIAIVMFISCYIIFFRKKGDSAAA